MRMRTPTCNSDIQGAGMCTTPGKGDTDRNQGARAQRDREFGVCARMDDTAESGVDGDAQARASAAGRPAQLSTETRLYSPRPVAAAQTPAVGTKC